jgi:16S rRNA (uracil1498-N3)-methyltransferase
MRVYLAEGLRRAGEQVALDEAEAHHLRVRRSKVGEIVELGDGVGGVGRGELQGDGREWRVVIQEWQRVPQQNDLVLAVAAGDRDRFIWLAEKCTELGVTRLIPLETENSSRVETRLRSGPLDKARRRALEAGKQSGNPWVTVIDDLTPISRLTNLRDERRWLVADGGGEPFAGLPLGTAIGWVIGPEGGLTASELATLKTDLDARAASLGPYVMRFETAAIVAAGVSTAIHTPLGA